MGGELTIKSTHNRGKLLKILPAASICSRIPSRHPQHNPQRHKPRKHPHNLQKRRKTHKLLACLATSRRTGRDRSNFRKKPRTPGPRVRVRWPNKSSPSRHLGTRQGAFLPHPRWKAQICPKLLSFTYRLRFIWPSFPTPPTKPFCPHNSTQHKTSPLDNQEW